MKKSAFRKRYGPWAVITGASSGIGRAVALDAARRGLHVVLVARTEPALRALGDDIETRYGAKTRVLAADLAQRAEADRVLNEISDLEVGLLVNAAGFGTSGPFIDTPARDELEMIDVNCRAVTALTHGFAPAMAARGHGGIVLFSSIVAFQGVARAANYAATKAFNQVLAEGLRTELLPRGVDVLASAPGPVNSGFGQRANMRMGAAADPSSVGRATLSALGKKGLVRPGMLSALLGYSLAILPRPLRRFILGRIMKGMT